MKRDAAFSAARRAGAVYADTRQGCLLLKDVAQAIKKRGALPPGASDFIFKRASSFERSFGLFGLIEIYDRKDQLLVRIDLRKRCPKP